MNYRHGYHAGNFADVFKHIILVLLIDMLQVKPTPITYMETHAGRGIYELDSVEAKKLKEYQFGIMRLLDYAKKNPVPECLKKYIDIILSLNFEDNVQIYPGSPFIAEALLREQDTMILCELHSEEFARLKENLHSRNSRMALHHMDGYLGMKAFLPLKTMRGLVHIDPPFEKTNEFESITDALILALKRWRMGMILVWYPIKDRRVVEKFQNTCKENTPSCLFVDFFVKNQQISSNLIGCGVVVINPPWKFKELLCDSVLPYLALALQADWEIKE